MSIRVVVSVVVLVFAAGSAWLAQSWRYDAKIAEIKLEHAQIMEAHAIASAAALADVRSIESKRITELEIARETAQNQAKSAQADASAARAAIGRLHNRIDQMVTDASAIDPTIASGGKTAQPAIDLLAKLLSKLAERSGQLAEYADRARIAGLTCEAIYEKQAN